MQNSVLNAADVQIDWQPVIDATFVEWLYRVSTGKAGKIPRRLHERIHGVGFAARGLGAGSGTHRQRGTIVRGGCPGRMFFQRITDAVASKLNVDSGRVYSNIEMHGNTSSASIPIALDECVEAGRIKADDLVLMASFGGGVTWGGVLVRW